MNRWDLSVWIWHKNKTILYWFFCLSIVLLTQLLNIGRAVNTIDWKQKQNLGEILQPGACECLGFTAQLDATVRLSWLQYPASYHGGSLVFRKCTFPQGHTFTVWQNVPTTMPAKDVIITGAYSINKYLITFKIGEDVVQTDSVA